MKNWGREETWSKYILPIFNAHKKKILNGSCLELQLLQAVERLKQQANCGTVLIKGKRRISTFESSENLWAMHIYRALDMLTVCIYLKEN